MHAMQPLRALVLALLCPLAQAQPAAPAAADPSDPKAPAAALIYQPALQHYQPLQDGPLRDWRAANRRVHEAGGWRAYLREAQPAPQPVPPGAKPAEAPAHKH